MKDLRAFALVGVGLLMAASPMSGQGIRVEVGAAYATLSGDDFEGTKGGIGFEGALVLRLNPKWSLAAGVMQTSHDEEDESLGSSTVLQIFGEPRYMFSSSGKMTPFLFGRVAWLNGKSDDFDAKATGFAFGGGVGLLYAFSGSVSLNLGGGFHKVSFGDQEFEGETIPASDISGTSMILRGGISIGFGGSSALKTHPQRNVTR